MLLHLYVTELDPSEALQREVTSIEFLKGLDRLALAEKSQQFVPSCQLGSVAMTESLTFFRWHLERSRA